MEITVEMIFKKAIDIIDSNKKMGIWCVGSEYCMWCAIAEAKTELDYGVVLMDLENYNSMESVDSRTDWPLIQAAKLLQPYSTYIVHPEVLTKIKALWILNKCLEQSKQMNGGR